MKRSLFSIAVAITALALVASGAAAQPHHKRHHSRAHHSRAHHSRVRHERFGAAATNPTTGGTTTPTPSDTAGTIKSFTGGVLTLTLNDGSTVSGTVDTGTEIECEAADNEIGDNFRADHGPGGGDNSGSGDDHGGSGGDHGDRGDDNRDRGAEQSCSMANLVAGAVVRSADLRISSAGSVWDKVELAG